MLLSIIKKCIPKTMKASIRVLLYKKKIYELKRVHKNLLKKTKSKDKIKLAFLLVDESIWKYDYVYELFKKNPRYELVIFNCPPVQYGEQLMHERMDHSYSSFKKRGYNIVDTRKESGKWLNIKAEYKPDLVFFCTPWGHTIKEYQIENFLDTLTVYVPYGFKNSNLYQYHFNKSMMNFSWKFFLETNIHQKLSRKYALNKGRNTVVTGFPGMDIFLNPHFKPNAKVWKTQDKNKKNIIWAPHHTIEGFKSALNYSTFLLYADFMLEVAIKYKDDLQIAFKPHPVLKRKLNEIWGERKTNAYYRKWEELPNGQVEEGVYIDLFATSDAMIHDSGSFVIEYLYTGKPVMFLISSEEVKEEFNEIGKEALKNIEKGYHKEDVINFIEAVIDGEDKLKEKRTAFFTNLVKPPHNKMASENIYDYINAELKN